MKRIGIVFLTIFILLFAVSCVSSELQTASVSEISILENDISKTESVLSEDRTDQVHSSGTVSEESAIESSDPVPETKILSVHYLDVGQGDAIWIELPNGETMLIDAGEAKNSKTVTDYIHSRGYDRISYVIATHPHSDHIGGMRAVLEKYEVGKIFLPNVSATTDTFLKMAETIVDRKIEAHIAEAGEIVFSFPELQLEAKLLAPVVINPKDQNENSAVMLLTYGERRFLFNGDANSTVEEMLREDVSCDVLKVGHHGSRTSSGEAFLSRCNPAYAIISCGEGNAYGHPHAEALERLKACGAVILRTDLLGNIIIESDGSVLRIRNEKPADTEEPTKIWVLNTSSQKIHYKDCTYAKQISERNYAESELTIAELLDQGYTPCGVCKPKE